MIIYGTRYYFTSDKVVRTAICSMCKRQATLTSYTGTKCFHIYFIPLIPLGKNRITDECSSCRRHYVLNFKQWESARQLGISGSLEKFRSNPTPESAIGVHNEMLKYREFDRANEFRTEAQQMFPNNAPILAAFGAAIEQTQDRFQAEPFYQRALQLRPDLPAARIGVAKSLIITGQLDEARELLNFMSAPGAAQLFDLTPLENLGYAYQRAGRHREALEVFQNLMTQLPEIGKMPNFQKAVKLSQSAVMKAGGEAMIKLPAAQRTKMFQGLRRGPGNIGALLILVGIIVVVVVVGGAFRLSYVSNHRRFYIVNGFDTPASVSIDDQTVTVQPNSPLLVDLPEGKKTIKVISPVQATYVFDLTYGDTFSRLFDSSETVFNIDGEAVIELDRMHYTPTDEASIPTETSFVTGQAFGQYQNVDYPFTPIPTTISIDSHSSGTVKYAMIMRKPSDYILYLENQNRTEELLSYLEKSLLAHPNDEKLMAAYANDSEENLHRMKAFLMLHLPFNPVSIPWHRQFQKLAYLKEREALRAHYDQELLKNPTDSDLLYLRSRLAYDLNELNALVDRSLVNNPNNYWAIHATAYAHRVMGDWAESELRDRKAASLSGGDEFDEDIINALIAQNKTKDAEAGINSQLKSRPTSLSLNKDLMTCYSKEGNYDEVIRIQNKEIQALQNIPDSDFPDKQMYITEVHITADSLTNNFAKLEQDADVKDHPLTHFMALVGQKKWDAVRALQVPDGMDTDISSALLSSAAARADGQADLADKLFSKCIVSLSAQGNEKKLLLSILQSPTPPPQTDVDNLNEDVEVKVAVLAALAYIHPESKHDYCAAAQPLHAVPSLNYFIADPLIK